MVKMSKGNGGKKTNKQRKQKNALFNNFSSAVFLPAGLGGQSKHLWGVGQLEDLFPPRATKFRGTANTENMKLGVKDWGR